MARRDITKAREVMVNKRSKFEDAFQYKVLNPSLSTQKLAEMFGVDRSGLHRYIKSKTQEAESTSGIHNAKNAVMGIKNGLDTLKILQESTNRRDVEIAEKALKTLEEYYPEMKSIFASIQNRVLNALDRETQTMESMGELTIDNIAKAQTILKLANDTNSFIPKTPLVAVQNNIQNNQNANFKTSDSDATEKPKNEIEFKISFVGKDDKKEEPIDGEVIDH